MIKFYDLMRSGHIKRWHVVNTCREQTLAEHQFNVTCIALELHEALIGGAPPMGFVMRALFHDVAEIRYGDIPTPGKALMRSSFGKVIFNGEQFDPFEALDEMVCPEVPYINAPWDAGDHGDYARMIKLADAIEAAWWIGENGVGTHARSVADRCRQHAVDLTVEYGWFREVNQVLQALGMPYINEDVITTPP